MAATPFDQGYWLVAADGNIYPFGDAEGLGSTGGMNLNEPVVGIAASPAAPDTLTLTRAEPRQPRSRTSASHRSSASR